MTTSRLRRELNKNVNSSRNRRPSNLTRHTTRNLALNLTL
jgi:hypothetical protein